jgi:hypothetical protein
MFSIATMMFSPKLFQRKSFTVLAVSQNPGKVGRGVIVNLVHPGFPGREIRGIHGGRKGRGRCTDSPVSP